MSPPAEHPPVHFPDDDTGAPPDPAENEARWDALFTENRRKQERERVMEEQLLRGEDTREALEAAINEVVPQLDWADEAGGEENASEDLAGDLDFDEPTTEDEPWRESLPDTESDHDHEEPFSAMLRHPLQQQATNLLCSFFDLAKRNQERSANIDTLVRNAMEITGGLAQVLPLPPSYEMDDGEVGLSLVQLKRALRGAAFVQGTLFLLRSEKTITENEFKKFIAEVESLSAQILDLLRTIRKASA